MDEGREGGERKGELIIVEERGSGSDMEEGSP